MRLHEILTWIRDHVRPIAGKHGRPRRTTKSAPDATDGKSTADRFRMFVNDLPVAIILVDRQGRIVQTNRHACKLFGYDGTELLRRPIETLIPPTYHQVHRTHVEQYYMEPKARPMKSGLTLGACHKNGHSLLVNIGLNPILTEEGQHTLATVFDVTAPHRIEQELRDMNEQLARANAELDEFALVASHDLREPLRKLVSFSNLLPSDLGVELPGNAKDDIDFIIDSANRMQRLVDDLLVLSRSGRRPVQRQIIDLNECADDAMEILSAVIVERRVTITRDALPSVMGDKTLLTQVYQNLLGNAIKFVPPGRDPVIHLTVVRSENHWTLGVRDNGAGIAPENLQAVFAPFHRTHDRTDVDGSGIGLSICQKAVERHGGKIWTESQVGTGSHFQFSLPMGETVAQHNVSRVHQLP